MLRVALASPDTAHERRALRISDNIQERLQKKEKSQR